ncbi:hypothetical protein SPSIL_046200 [Sporomusa silvacetica DSM 10669]|uniref:PNPLA domain-containing protein n=1 Tax=Sporomusa silvacetica DSM 10669 TaxID=1123289 RepID=A0ABZ3ISJ3_9FIRM|nr:patatin-like phospholipase family protein [Sporomusa silvacetica]OZC15337.1 NTE family protein RssA [Sporomusa silvacetica DSM 10669]
MTDPNQHLANRSPKIGVVLGGGGWRALAAIGLFEFLDEANLPIDLLVGCSGGGIMAALRGAGFTPDEMKSCGREFWNPKLFSRLDYRTILDILGLPFGQFSPTTAILRPHRLLSVCKKIFKEQRLEEFHPRTILQTTDIRSGLGIALNRGQAANAVYATTAQFPFLPPLAVNNQLLVDGSYISSLPVMEAVRHNMDIIIAMSFDNHPKQEPAHFFDHYWQFINKILTTGERSQTALAISLHHHEMILINVHFGYTAEFFSDEGLADIIATGREAVRSRKNEILGALESFTVPVD